MKAKRQTKISHTCETAREEKMQILQSGPQTVMVPGIWEEV